MVEQQPIEIILLRQVAEHLANAVVLADPAGTLIFYNDPAEALLGARFDEFGEIPRETWEPATHARDAAGVELSPNELPLTVAVDERRAADREYEMRRPDGEWQRLRVVAIPLAGQQDRFLGAVAFFWPGP
jgi:PAS domain-containing protein